MKLCIALRNAVLRSFYFIPSSEFNAYLKQISDIVYSEKISYFFTKDEYDVYFFTVANGGCFNS